MPQSCPTSVEKDYATHYKQIHGYDESKWYYWYVRVTIEALFEAQARGFARRTILLCSMSRGATGPGHLTLRPQLRCEVHAWPIGERLRRKLSYLSSGTFDFGTTPGAFVVFCVSCDLHPTNSFKRLLKDMCDFRIFHLSTSYAPSCVGGDTSLSSLKECPILGLVTDLCWEPHQLQFESSDL